MSILMTLPYPWTAHSSTAHFPVSVSYCFVTKNHQVSVNKSPSAFSFMELQLKFIELMQAELGWNPGFHMGSGLHHMTSFWGPGWGNGYLSNALLIGKPTTEDISSEYSTGQNQPHGQVQYQWDRNYSLPTVGGPTNHNYRGVKNWGK